MTSSVTFRHLTQDDVLTLYGKSLACTVQGYAGEKDGALLGIFGVYYEGGRLIAFSEIAPEGKKEKKGILKGCRLMLTLLDSFNRPSYAVPNRNEPTAMYLLVKLGWKPTGMFGDAGEVFKREPSWHS